MTTSPHENLYHRILNLPKEVTAPDFYQLLGLKRFESDPKTIKKAAMDRTSLLQVMQNAENYDEVKRLERDVGEAMVCLSNPQRKAEYDQSLRESVPLKELPPPKPVAPATETLASPTEQTVEVKILPPTPPPKAAEKPASPVPKSGIRFLPPATGGKKKKEKSAERKEKDSQKFLKGEVPWQFGEHWWQKHPELAKRAAIGAGALLLLVLVISFWPSSSADETVAEKEVQTTPNSSQQAAAISKVIQPANVGSLTSQVLFRNPSGSLEDFAMAPDAGWVATLDGDGIIRLWEESTGTARELNTQGMGMMGGGGARATQIAATPDGGHLFAATAMGQLQEWPISAPDSPPGFITSPMHESPHFASGVFALEVMPDGQRVIGSNANSEVFVFDRNTLQTTAKEWQFDDRPLRLLTSPSTGNQITLCCKGQSFQLWSPDGLLPGLQMLVPAKIAKLDLAAAYSPGATHLAAAGTDHQIRVIDLANIEATPIICQGHADRIYALGFSPDGSLLVSAGADRTVRLWKASTGTELAMQGGHARTIVAAAFTEDGTSFFTASREGVVRKWFLGERASEPIPVLPAMPQSGSSNAETLAESNSSRWMVSHQFQLSEAPSLAWASVSPDGTCAAASNARGNVVIHDTRTGRLRHVLPISVRDNGPVRFSSDGQTLVAVDTDGRLSSWDVVTGRKVDLVAYQPTSSEAPEMAMSAASHRLVLPKTPDEVEIRTDFENLAAVTLNVRLSQTCLQLAITPDGRYLAANLGAAMEIWDLGDPADAPSPRRLSTISLLDGSSQRVLTLSPNGEMCAVGTETGKIHVFATRTGKELASFTGHTNGQVKGLTFDSQGSLLFSIGNESGVRVWNAKTWSLAAWLSSPPSPGAMSPARMIPVPGAGYGPGFSGANAPPIKLHMTADGKQLIVVDQTGQGVVWEVGQADNPRILADVTPADLSVGGSTQTLTSKNFAAIAKWSESPAHPQRVTHLDYSPDGKSLLTAGMDGIIRVWNGQTGSLQRQIVLPPAPAVSGLPGGNPLGVVPGLGEVPDVFGPAMDDVGSAGGLRHWAISSGNLLATSMDGRLIQLWDIATGANRGKIGDPKEDHVWFGFSPDGKTFFTLLNTGLLKSWNIADLSLAKSTPLRTGTAFASAPAGSGVLFALGDADGTVWVVKTDETLIQLGGNSLSHSVQRLQFSKDGKLLAALDAAGSIRVWEMASRTEILRSDSYGQPHSDLEFTPDGKALLTLSPMGMLALLTGNPTNRTGDPSRPTSIGVQNLPGIGLDPYNPQTVVNGSKSTGGTLLALSPDGMMLAIAGGIDSQVPSGQGTLAFWGVGEKPDTLNAQNFAQGPKGNSQTITRANLSQIQLLASVPGHKSVQSVAFCPDGQAFVSGGSDNLASVWDAHSNPLEKLHTLSGHAYPVLAVAASRTNVATGDSKGYIKIWDRQTGQELHPNTKKAQHSGGVQDLAFSPNELYLGSAGQDKLVKIWSPQTLTEATQLQQEHNASVLGLTWVDDNNILSCDSGNRIFHWRDLLIIGKRNVGLGFDPLFSTTPVNSKPKEIKGFGVRINAIDSATGNKAAFASENDLVGLWNGNNGPKELPHRLESHTKPVKCVAFTPNGSVLASAGGDNTILFWSTDGVGELLHTLEVPLPMGESAYQIQALDFSPDGHWLLTGDAGGHLKLWGVRQP